MRTSGSVRIFGRSAIADASPEPKEIELHLALRPYVTAGVALVGAGVIAVTPAIAPPASIQPQTQAIELTAAVDPLTQWAGIITRTVTEASQFAQTIAANPAPILQQITQNQLGNAQTVSNALQAFANGMGAMLDPSRPGGTVYLLIEAVRHLQQGDPVAASQAAWNGILGFLYQALPLSNLTSIQATMATNFGKAVTELAKLPYSIGFVSIGIAHAPFQAFEETSAAVMEALADHDPTAAAVALVSFPGTVVDYAVNGYPVGNLRLGGLLGGSGLFQTLNNARTKIAKAIAPPAPAAAFTEQIAASTPNTTPSNSDTTQWQDETDLAPTENAPLATPPTALAAKTVAAEKSPVAHAAAPEPAGLAAAPLVRTGLIAAPDKSGARGPAIRPAAKAVSPVRDGITATVNKLGEGVKKAFNKPDKTAKPDNVKSSEGSNSAGKHRAGSGKSGDAE
ncbi:hypothetical protein HGK72_21745 [Mycolicibacterium fortuitum]|uniref:hypothetical protein n=1 Tax=Mycolicibacterium fortuitum TaxID=1766 RepID=UPI00104208D7|nr:hypothetical protein [Mycolicibacterium fortuitum]NOR02670.1 hypothetical protein [Mycolicibacterium fortuitum]